MNKRDEFIIKLCSFLLKWKRWGKYKYVVRTWDLMDRALVSPGNWVFTNGNCVLYYEDHAGWHCGIVLASVTCIPITGSGPSWRYSKQVRCPRFHTEWDFRSLINLHWHTYGVILKHNSDWLTLENVLNSMFNIRKNWYHAIRMLSTTDNLDTYARIARKFYRTGIVPPSGVGLDHPTWKEVRFDHI